MGKRLGFWIGAGVISLTLWGGDARAQSGGGPQGGQPPSLDSIFDHLDTNKDGNIDPTEFQQGHGPGGPGGQGGPPTGTAQPGGPGGGPPPGGPGGGGPPPGGGGGGHGGRHGGGPGGGPGGGGPPPGGPGGGGPPGGGPGGGPGGPPGGGPGGHPPRLPSFAFLDADGNGLISKTEFVAGMTLWHDAHEDFRNADTDKNGQLSAAEYQAGGFSTALSALDTDGDGSVSGREFMEWVEQNRRAP